MVYSHELSVDVGAQPARPLAEQVVAARAAHPEGDVVSVIPPVEATDTTKVVFNLPELGEKQHTVYVDPYTNRVRGTLTTWFDESPLMTWLDDLHRNLHFGVVGRHYSELAASWLWVVVLGGLFLWLRRQWTGRRKLRRTVLPDLAAKKGVRRTRGWHAVTGVWLAVGLLVLSATGLTWSRYAGANFDVVQDGFDAHSPTLETALPGTSSGGSESGVSPPAEPGTAWTVAQDDPVWPYGWDRAAVDPATGTVVAMSEFADWPLLAQLSKLGVAFHMGFLFGIVNQILLAALAVGLLCMIVWGYRMWWQRRPTRVDRRAPLGTPPDRGAWRQTHPLAAVAVLLVAVAVGWALPVLGVTLAAFLASTLFSVRSSGGGAGGRYRPRLHAPEADVAAGRN